MRMIGWLATAGCSFMVFIGLASEFVQEGEFGHVDALVAEHIRQFASPAATRFFQLVSDLHGTVPVSIVVVLIALPLLYRKAYHDIAWLFAAVPGGMLLNVAVKHGLQRPRPTLSSILTADSYSFPSGHTAGATLLYGFLLALVFARTRLLVVRSAATVVGVTAVLAVAVSRIYLQVHYASDVTAALFESIGWLSLCLAARAFIDRRSGVDTLSV